MASHLRRKAVSRGETDTIATVQGDVYRSGSREPVFRSSFKYAFRDSLNRFNLWVIGELRQVVPGGGVPKIH